MLHVNKDNIKPNSDTKLLFYCLNPHIDAHISEKITYLIEEDLNWFKLIHKAQFYGLIPLIYSNLKNFDNVPPIVIDYLRKQFENHIQKNLLLTGELIKIVDLFNKNDMLSVPYKGPTLAVSAYGSLSLRSFEDINIFILEKDREHVKEILMNNGYERDMNSEGFKKKIQTRYNSKDRFIKNGALIEIQWKIPGFNFPFDERFPNYGLNSFENTLINNFNFLSFSPEDTIVLLCISAAYHFWWRLKDLCDIAVYINSHKFINWSAVFNKALELGTKRIVTIGICLVQDLFKLQLTEDMLNFSSYGEVETILKQLKMRIYSREEVAFTFYNEAYYKLKMRDNLKNGLKDVIRTSLVPNYSEWKKINVPQIFIPFYMLYWPFHMLHEYNWVDTNKFSPLISTNPFFIDKILEMSEIKSGEILFDLGCGDGRIPIMAAKKYGIDGIGVDLDNKNIQKSRNNAFKEGVHDKTRFYKQNLLKTDLSDADIIFLYLYPSLLNKLADKFKEEIKPNTRILTRDFQINGFKPTKKEIIVHGDEVTGLYLYKF